MSLPKPKTAAFEFEGETFHVHAVNGTGRVAIRKILLGEEDSPTRDAKFVASGLSDENGSLKYDVTNEAHLKEIAEADGGFIGKAIETFFDASGIAGKSDEAAEKK